MRHTPFLISLRGIDILLCGSVIPAWVISVFAMLRRLKSSLSRKSGTQDDVWEVRESLIRQGHTIFDLQTLRVATRDFHRDNKLGEGALGVVYKGRTDEREIAVKKLWMVMSRQVMKQVTNGLKFMGKIRHRNILKLLGCCTQGAEILLVYEYLPNGSLDAILFGPGKSIELDWQKRHNIITGIARGLVYLHHDSHLRIVHRDITATNILLDDKLNPKIGGFGLAKLFPEDETHLQTRIAGTRGYMAPESMQGQLSVKVDVYSFGVLLLEIVSGRKNIDFNQPEGTEYLVEWAWRLHKQGHVLEMIDPTLMGRYPQEQVLRCIQVGLLCTEDDPANRPEMLSVILMISGNSVALPNPAEPALVSVTDSLGSIFLPRRHIMQAPILV